MSAAIHLATDVADAIRNRARAANRAGNTAAAEAYWAAADLITEAFKITGEPA